MKNYPFLFSVCLLSTLYFPCNITAQCTWNGTTGNWSDGTKWSCGHAPLAAENAVINAGTITLDVAPTITDLTMNGGTITGTNDLTVNGNLSMTNLPVLGNTGDVTVAGTFTWSGGTIGSAAGTATGTVNITGLTTMATASSRSLNKKTLNLNSGANYSGGQISLGYNCVLNIPVLQSFNANAASNWSVSNGGGVINNAGTFDKQGAGALAIPAIFNNTGTLQVTGGTLTLSGGGTHNGAFSISSGATFKFGGGTHDLSTSTISGTGSLEISAGSVTLPNNSSHGDVLASSGTANFSGATTMQNLTVTSGTVNISGSLSVQNLTFTNVLSGSLNGTGPIAISGYLDMSNGVLGNTGDVTVAGTFAWSGGTLGSTDGTATGTINITGLTTISGSGKTLNKKTLNLNNGANYTAGQISMRYNCVLNIPGGQAFNANAAANWSVSNGGGVINNAGTFDKQGTGTLSIPATFNNTGTVQVTGGFLNLSGGGTHNGAFSIAAIAGLEFGGGTNNLNTSTISGTGSLEISGGTVTLPNNSTHGDVLATSGTANFSGANTMQNLTVTSGTINISGSVSLQNITFTNVLFGNISGTGSFVLSGNLDMSNGVFGNTGDVTVAGTFAWAGGTIGSSDGTATGTVNIAGLTTISGSGKTLNKKTLNLNNGANYTAGQIAFQYNCVLNIPAAKSFIANAAANWSAGSGGGGTFNNAGTFDKQGVGAVSIAVVFNNTGTLQVTGGTLTLSGGGTHNGAFGISSGATLKFGGGINDLSTSTISGTGSLEITGGTVTLPNNSTHGDVLATSGTANFSGANTMQNLTVTSGTVNISGSVSLQNITFTNVLFGNISGTGSFVLSGNLDMSNGIFGNTGDVTVAGTFAWAGGTIGSSDGSATGTVSIAGLTTITNVGNRSLHKKTLNLNGGASVTSSSFNLYYGCIMNLPAGQTFLVNTSSGTSWNNSGAVGTFNNAGTFTKQGAGTLTVSSTFVNSGTITGTSTIVFSGTFTNTGLISPGASPGILNLNKTTTGITVQNLAIELEGPSPGTGGYDQLNNTTGPLNLNGGTLTVTLLNGYLPNVGTTFTIATGTSRTGTFGTLNLPVDNARWTVTYNATNVVLTVALNLPVELLDFQAKRMGPKVRLNWTTATEHDNRGFGIERSSDGRDFENIAFVEGKGDSEVRVDYTFEDPAPPAAKVIYYRLRQEDISGKMEYSPVRSVEGAGQTTAAIWPNPVAGAAVLHLDLPVESSVSGVLTDLQGRVLQHLFSSVLPKGAQRIEIPEMTLPAGQYLLRLQTGERVQYIPFVKH